jgi:hypothetical protein
LPVSGERIGKTKSAADAAFEIFAADAGQPDPATQEESR